MARLRYEWRDGASRLADLRQEQPLRALFPAASANEPAMVALVNVAGGMVAGDAHDVAVEVGPRARVTAVAQAAEKIYRSEPSAESPATAGESEGRGPSSTVRVALRCHDGGWLEWIPQETILFQGARLRRVTTIEAGRSARVLAGEMLALGRTAHGERFTRGLLTEDWRVRLDGRLIWADALRLEGEFADILDSPAGFGGATRAATLVYLGPDAAELLEPLRGLFDKDKAIGEGGADRKAERVGAAFGESGAGGAANAPQQDGEPNAGDVRLLRSQRPQRLAPPVRAGATLVHGLLLARWLAADGLALRESYARAWSLLRSRAGGLAPRMPRLWHM